MANPEHLAILKQGVKAWNLWRKQNPHELPDLVGANLAEANLSDAELSHADLRHADLSSANLSNAELRCASLHDVDLRLANLGGAKLNEANLRGAKLTSANLSNANINSASLSFADLSAANLGGANLCGAELNNVNLEHADLNHARVWSTVLGGTDLSDVKGLETVKHHGPSSIGVDTLYKSHGKIPDKFLRDAGVSEDVIEHLLPLIRTGPPIQCHSCFISYSTKDEEFARRLHDRMREAGLRVWFAPEDIKGGDNLYDQISRAIQYHDKLLVVLSEHSIKSEWVLTEIRKAREVEKKENRRKLFPIRLVDFDTLRDWTCFDADTGKDLAVEVREYAMPNDFSNWKDRDAFEKSFARLLQDLKAETRKP